jgi:hypothetical protein
MHSDESSRGSKDIRNDRVLSAADGYDCGSGEQDLKPIKQSCMNFSAPDAAITRRLVGRIS